MLIFLYGIIFTVLETNNEISEVNTDIENPGIHETVPINEPSDETSNLQGQQNDIMDLQGCASLRLISKHYLRTWLLT